MNQLSEVMAPLQLGMRRVIELIRERHEVLLQPLDVVRLYQTFLTERSQEKSDVSSQCMEGNNTITPNTKENDMKPDIMPFVKQEFITEEEKPVIESLKMENGVKFEEEFLLTNLTDMGPMAEHSQVTPKEEGGSPSKSNATKEEVKSEILQYGLYC